MKCDVVQNRLLALADPRRVPEELRGHLAACDACRAFAALAGRLDGLVAAVPVPPADEAVKLAFLDRLTELGPIIKRIPSFTRASDSSATLKAVLARTGRWRTLVGLAAGVLVAGGVWWAVSTPDAGPPSATAQRHVLLNKVVRSDAELANAETAPKKLTILAARAQDLREEARDVYLAAQDGEMRTLARWYEATVADGIVLLAEKHLPPHMDLAERKKLVAELDARLATDEAEAARLADQAPPPTRPGLQKIAASAKAGRAKLRALADRGGA
jgi:hypothetical protein